MRIYVMADIEGISGVYCREQVIPGENRFAEGRKFLTEDINACVAGLRDAGVEYITVHDCHGGGYSLNWADVSPEADGYICGAVGDRRFVDLQEYDGIILLGYHAMAGTAEAVLEHTYSSKSVQNMYLNGKAVGEVAVDAAIAGQYGVPVIMVSGDDKLCAEAKRFLPDVVTAQVKKGLACQGAELLSPQKAHQLIHDKAMEAVRKLTDMKPYVIPAPVECKMEMVERNRLPNTMAKPYIRIVDGRTFELTADSVEQALAYAFW